MVKPYIIMYTGMGHVPFGSEDRVKNIDGVDLIAKTHQQLLVSADESLLPIIEKEFEGWVVTEMKYTEVSCE